MRGPRSFCSPKRRKIGLDRLLLLTASWVAAGFAVSPSASWASSAGGSTEHGKKAYNAACAECHGSTGLGDGEKARRLGFHVRNFESAVFKCRSTPSGSLPTDEDLLRLVARGMAGTPMHGHEKDLSSEDRQAIVQYVKSLSPKFATAPAPQCIDIPEPIPPSDQTVSEGKQLYRLLNCWSCHGKSGKGDGPSSGDLKDDLGRPIRPYNFTAAKKFKCGDEDRDLYRTLNTGMDGSPMPSYRDALLFDNSGEKSEALPKSIFSAAEIEELTQYLKLQPDAAGLKTLTPEARQALLARRTWALVHYIKSLLAP